MIQNSATNGKNTSNTAQEKELHTHTYNRKTIDIAQKKEREKTGRIHERKQKIKLTVERHDRRQQDASRGTSNEDHKQTTQTTR